MIWRGILVLAVALAIFGWGVVTGVYRTFPWDAVQPLGQQVTGVLRSVGLMPAEDEAASLGERIEPDLSAFTPVEEAPGAAPVAIAETPAPPPPVIAPVPADETAPVLVPTILQNFDLTILSPGAAIPGTAGGMAATPEGMLFARAPDGTIFHLPIGGTSLRPLAIRLPDRNADKVPAAAEGAPKYNPGFHRYNDLHLWDRPGGKSLLVSYQHYDDEAACFTARLDQFVLPDDWQPTDAEPAGDSGWTTIFESSPCLPINTNRHYFPGHQAGGRMAEAPDGSIVLGIGDYEYDGDRRPDYPQADDNTYGKLVRIAADGTVSVVSKGHRNPQGIAFDASGRLFTAEHSAMGGDELNLIVEGNNYGWPVVNLGVDYVSPASDTRLWRSNPQQGRHEGFVPPIFAWLPSIAPGALKYVTGFNEVWEGDLLVGTLADQSLRRLRLAGDAVLYDERIRLGQRVRDFEFEHERLVILFDSGLVGVMTPRTALVPGVRSAREMATEVLHEHGCLECHGRPGSPPIVALNTSDIASQPGVDYSEALLAVEGQWGPQRLRAFLNDPQAFAPGTTMPTPELGSESLEAVLQALLLDTAEN